MVIRNNEVAWIRAHSTSLRIMFPNVCSINPLKYQCYLPSHACCFAGTSWSQNSTPRLHLDVDLKWALLPAMLFFSSLTNIELLKFSHWQVLWRIFSLIWRAVQRGPADSTSNKQTKLSRNSKKGKYTYPSDKKIMGSVLEIIVLSSYLSCNCCSVLTSEEPFTASFPWMHN